MYQFRILSVPATVAGFALQIAWACPPSQPEDAARFLTAHWSYRPATTVESLATITDVSGLERPIQLEDVCLLQHLPQLETLDLSGHAIDSLQMGDEFPLRALSGLRVLGLGSTRVRSVPRGSVPTGLRKLRLKYTNGWTEQAGPGATAFESLAGVTELEQLEDLDLDGTHVTDFTPILGLAHLKRLHLHWNHLRSEDLAVFAGAAFRATLEVLYLDRNDLTSVAPLQVFTAIRELVVDENPIVGECPVLNAASQGLAQVCLYRRTAESDLPELREFFSRERAQALLDSVAWIAAFHPGAYMAWAGSLGREVRGRIFRNAIDKVRHSSAIEPFPEQVWELAERAETIDVNASERGMTLLMIAAQNLWVEGVERLLTLGADRSAVDYRGRTALEQLGVVSSEFCLRFHPGWETEESAPEFGCHIRTPDETVTSAQLTARIRELLANPSVGL